MASVTTTFTKDNLAELLDRLGGVPLERIQMSPTPGTATEKDVIAARESPAPRLFELVDGVLVEKAMGFKESILAGALIQLLRNYLTEYAPKLGTVLAPDGTVQLMPGLVRIPDAAFVTWERIGAKQAPDNPMPHIIPELVIEVLSKGNTKNEMKRKLKDYFDAGVQEAWLINPRTESAEVYSSSTKKRRIGIEQALEGGTLLPGFALPLKALFATTRCPD